jgi:hypothetical protein
MFVQRIKDPSAIEARLLELAHTTDAKITAAALAYYAPCSIEDASKVLDAMTVKDQLSIEVDDDGVIHYEMPGRQQFKAPPMRALAPIVPRTIVRQPFVHTPSPMLAAVLTLFIPGAGHLYAGKWISALLWFLVVGAGYSLLLPGLVLHMFATVSAAGAASRMRFRALAAGAPPQARLLAA